MRMHGHGAHDDMSYVPPGMLEEWERRDPIERYAERLVAEHGFAADEVEEIRSEVKAYIAECAERALASPMPEPEAATEGVFAEEWQPLGDGDAPWSRWQEAGAPSTATATAASPRRGRPDGRDDLSGGDLRRPPHRDAAGRARSSASARTSAPSAAPSR